ncbi:MULTISPECIES: septum site-determining protein MinC [Carboxydocella]|uniref:Probable septum site-determining protein MinC n=2 Tax=Carboxydocella TaxID=178898 RepID=A0A1T4LT80_9FIRM|nr:MULTISPECIES: septum site-determining protein MinC [Carboxydocella]AVX20600.1 septum site-determining protein MinC [Carboxydocella thermautotrophica]AVX31022.1 septum site-determining protein MinC [Carboxydocella thermautotrophica]SJZ57867.1 septum site-determining protein MinC [Carboxydocella sporoproducens DSM 16521]GAW27923.1 septum site-determining protein MinC [Carboxydocella sp. ULO1]GAW31528.1 septum site-determining protein MinC [Carboxydocella sp. JDF658]
MYEGVSIKGTKNGLVILIDENLDKKILLKDIERKMQQARGFFKGATFAVATRSGSVIDDGIKEDIEKICLNHGLIPQSESQVIWHNFSQRTLAAQATDIKNETGVEYIKGTLRSGCRVESNGDIVLIGDVNPNAELVSAGNICVFGTIKGIVHAGATGNANATIMAYSFRPQQIRIGSVFSRNPEQDLPGQTGNETLIPEIAYIYNNTILIEKYKDYSARRK